MERGQAHKPSSGQQEPRICETAVRLSEGGRSGEWVCKFCQVNRSLCALLDESAGSRQHAERMPAIAFWMTTTVWSVLHQLSTVVLPLPCRLWFDSPSEYRKRHLNPAFFVAGWQPFPLTMAGLDFDNRGCHDHSLLSVLQRNPANVRACRALLLGTARYLTGSSVERGNDPASARSSPDRHRCSHFERWADPRPAPTTPH